MSRLEVVRQLPPPPARYEERNEIEFRREVQTQMQETLTRLAPYISGTGTWDPASIANDAVGTTTITVRGARVGQPVSVGFSTLTTQDMLLSGNVLADDTVQVILLNKSGGAVDLASGTVTVIVWQV